MYKFNLLLTLGVLLLLQGDGGVEATFWPCESNNDCTAVGSTCDAEAGLCECPDFDTVFSEDFTQCLKTSQIGDTCTDTVQCNLMPTGANCKAGVCDCADGQTYVRGKCSPLNELNEPCETDLDCYFGYDRVSVSCQESVCACANGYYHRYGNICRRKSMEKDDACVVNTDCAALGAGASCVSLKCSYVDEVTTPGTEATNDDQETTTEQITETTEQNETETTETEDSTTTIAPAAAAVKKQIAKAFVHAPPPPTPLTPLTPLTNGGSDYETDTEPLTAKRRSREIAVQTSLEKYELRDLGRSVRNVGTTTTATTSTSTSSRRNSSHRRRRLHSIFRFDDEDIKTYSTLGSSRDDDDVEADDKKYGSQCTDNGKACSGLPHSVCTNKICLCRQGYYARNGKCFAELGEIAESSDECEYDFDELSRTCICQKNYFYERDLRNCRKPIQYHLSCTSNSQCSPFGAAFCHPEIPRRCTCEEYAEYDALTQLCEYKQGLGAECESNDGCPVPHSICSNRECVCQDNYFVREGECVAGIGAECLEDVDCTDINAICQAPSNSNSTKESEDQTRSCQCRKGYVHFKDECLKEAEELEEDCIEDEQCKPLLASCSAERKCSCTNEQHEKNGRCEVKRNLGDACGKATECFVEKDPENVECRNSVCQCKFNYQADTTQKHCIRVMPNKKNSSGRPSALKIITFILIGSAFLITSAAIKQAYY